MTGGKLSQGARRPLLSPALEELDFGSVDGLTF
jgi:hypothetical protein